MKTQLTPEELAHLRKEANFEHAEFNQQQVNDLLDHIEARELAFKDLLQSILPGYFDYEAANNPIGGARDGTNQEFIRQNRNIRAKAAALGITLA